MSVSIIGIFLYKRNPFSLIIPDTTHRGRMFIDLTHIVDSEVGSTMIFFLSPFISENPDTLTLGPCLHLCYLWVQAASPPNFQSLFFSQIFLVNKKCIQLSSKFLFVLVKPFHSKRRCLFSHYNQVFIFFLLMSSPYKMKAIMIRHSFFSLLIVNWLVFLGKKMKWFPVAFDTFWNSEFCRAV